MTPLPPISGALKVQLGWGVDDETASITVMHLAYTGGPPSSGNCATMAAAIRADQVTRFTALLNASSGITSCRVLDLSSDMGGEGESGGFDSGTRTGDNLAAATAIVVSKHIARHYRGGHPRSYLPLGSATDLDSGLWDGGFADTVNTAWTDFVSDCTSDGTGCAITGEIQVSYVSGGARRDTPQKDTILSYTTDVKVGSQRRRNKRQ
jgi:hypothetical protein